MRCLDHSATSPHSSEATEGNSHRRQVIDRLTSGWKEAGTLRRDLTPQAAGDRLWLLTTVESYLNAADNLGWTPKEYETWLANLTETELLEPKK